MTLIRKITKKAQREAEAERARLQTGWIRDVATSGWHKLEFDGAIGTTRCGLVIESGGLRKGIPPAGALVCNGCTR